MTPETEQKLLDSVSRIETNLEWFKDSLDKGSKRMDKHDERADKQDAKISSIENKVWYGSGIAVGLATIIGWLKKLL